MSGRDEGVSCRSARSGGRLSRLRPRTKNALVHALRRSQGLQGACRFLRLVLAVVGVLACDRQTSEGKAPRAPSKGAVSQESSEDSSTESRRRQESDQTKDWRVDVKLLRSRDGASIRLPSEKPWQIVSSADGSELALWSSEDRRTLWARRTWDDGAIDLWQFETAEDGALYFVDGVLERRSPATFKGPLGNLVNRNLVRRDARVAERLLEAWLVRASGDVAHRPATGVTYSVVGEVSKSRLWAVYAPSCDSREHEGFEGRGCVLVGEPRDVCEGYWSRTRISPSWWIHPNDCEGFLPRERVRDDFVTID